MRKSKKTGEKERKREKKREKERKIEKKLNILAEMLELSKSGCRGSIYYNRPPSL